MSEMEKGFDAAIAAIESWAAGFYSGRTVRHLEAVAHDLKREKPHILAALKDKVAP